MVIGGNSSLLQRVTVQGASQGRPLPPPWIRYLARGRHSLHSGGPLIISSTPALLFSRIQSIFQFPDVFNSSSKCFHFEAFFSLASNFPFFF